MKGKIRALALAATMAAALALPAAPAHATTCEVNDPGDTGVNEVVCGVVWKTVAGTACRVKVWCY